MIEVTVVTNKNKILSNFSKLESKMDNLSVPLKQAGLFMIGSIDKNFRSQGRPKKWINLKPATIRQRRGGGFAAKILQDTGRLKQSIAMSTVSKSVVKVGTSVQYGKVHQLGSVSSTRRGVRVIPQRKFLLFQESDKIAIDKIFAKHISNQIKTVFRG